MFRRISEAAFSGIEKEAYYLMSIHEHLPARARQELEEVGWMKWVELEASQKGRIAVRLCTLVQKAGRMPKEDFRQAYSTASSGASRLTARASNP